jgi:hypothetical protein
VIEFLNPSDSISHAVNRVISQFFHVRKIGRASGPAAPTKLRVF